MNIQSFIKVFDVIPTEVCDIVNYYMESPNVVWSKHVWDNYSSTSTHSHEKNELDVSDSEPLNLLLSEYVKKSLRMYEDWLESENQFSSGVQKMSPIRLNRYCESAKMRPHIDLIKSVFDGTEKGIPTLTVLGELSGRENYSGGEFLVCGQEVELKRGQIIIFPSTFMYPHEVKEVKSGTRYSFVTWAY